MLRLSLSRFPPAKKHPTSYLDGLRGVACLIVFLCHYTEDNHYALTRAYQSPEARAFLQLPYIRLVFSGRPMVHLFFIISGFALSLKPLRLIHEKETTKAFEAVASSVIRRPIRLFGPPIVSTFLTMVFIRLGLLYQPMGGLGEQLYNWFWVMSNQVCWPWSWQEDRLPTYDVHLWTIPIEFSHSMLVFLFLVPLAVMKPNLRVLAIPALAVYCQLCGNWAGFEFVAGMLMAELHLRETNSKNNLSPMPLSEKETRRPFRSLMKTLFLMVSMSVILYLYGWPNLDRDMTPFFQTLYDATPRASAENTSTIQKFWFSISGLFTFWAVGQIPFVKTLLDTPLSQYLGRISYALYIVHGPVLNLMQQTVLGRAGEGPVGEPGTEGYSPGFEPSGLKGYFGQFTAGQMMMSWAGGLVIMGPVVILTADLFMRYVDIPMVKFARKVENFVMR